MKEYRLTQEKVRGNSHQHNKWWFQHTWHCTPQELKGREENWKNGLLNLEQAAVVHFASLHICQVTVGKNSGDPHCTGLCFYLRSKIDSAFLFFLPLVGFIQRYQNVHNQERFRKYQTKVRFESRHSPKWGSVTQITSADYVYKVQHTVVHTVWLSRLAHQRQNEF